MAEELAPLFGVGLALVFELAAAFEPELFAPEDFVAGLAEIFFPAGLPAVFAAGLAGDLLADFPGADVFAICLPDDGLEDEDLGGDDLAAGEDFSFPPPKIPRIRFLRRPPLDAPAPALPALFAPAAFFALSALVVVFELTAILLSRPL